MSSVPSEILLDVLLPLDHWTLDGAQFTDGRFLQLVTNHMSDVCLRKVKTAVFLNPNVNVKNANGVSSIQIDGPPDRGLKSEHKDTARFFSEFVQALRSSRVAFLSFQYLAFTPEFAALILQTPIFAGKLEFLAGSCVELAPTHFQKLLLHFSLTVLDIDSCRLRACQITDELVRELSKNCVRKINFRFVEPMDGGSFAVTDGGNLRLLCATGRPDRRRRAGAASTVSKRTRPLRVVVSPSPVAADDLRDFTQHLSYRYRGTPW